MILGLQKQRHRKYISACLGYVVQTVENLDGRRAVTKGAESMERGTIHQIKGVDI